jgi:hypothetical protein
MVFAYNGVYFKISETYAFVHNGWAFCNAYLPSYTATLIFFCPSVPVPSTLVAQVLMQPAIPLFVQPYMLVYSLMGDHGNLLLTSGSYDLLWA